MYPFPPGVVKRCAYHYNSTRCKQGHGFPLADAAGCRRPVRSGRVVKKEMRVYVPALISGGALVLCFPVFDYYFLAFAALAPFFVSLRKMDAGRAFKAGLAMGLVYFTGTLYWVYHSMYRYGGVPLLASFAIVFLLALYLSLFTGVFSLLFSRIIRRSSLPALVIAPICWVVLEFARSYALTGFPWASIGYSQYKFLRLIQFADITGVYGVSFIVVAVNGAIADLFITRKRREEMPLFHLFPQLAGYAALLLALLAVFLYGGHRLEEERPGGPLRVTLVQGNIEQDMKWAPAYQGFVLDTHETLTASALPGQAAPRDLVVWPESALPFYYGLDADLTSGFRNYQKTLGTPLLFGAITVKGTVKAKGKEVYRLGNSAVLLDDSGEKAYAYDKIHLVPFGEYVPLKGILSFIDKMVAGIGDYEPGKQYVRGRLPEGEFATVICYEIIFPGLVRKFFRDGGDFLVTITNDAWFGRTAGPYQHWSMAVLRAVENRKPVIRAANTGVSGFIDSSGRIIRKTTLFERVAISGAVRTDRTRTFYSKYGDLFSFFCISITVIILINLRRRDVR